MQPYGDYAFAIRIDGGELAAFAQRPNETRLRLFEDGIALERSGASEAAVKSLGEGRHFVTQRWLVFSSSDGSDPRENGRRYEATFFSGVPLVVFAGLLAAIAVTLCLILCERRFSPLVSMGSFALLATVVTAWWTAAVLSPEPQIVLSGDGGNVASVVAARLYPERFALDPVFSDPDHFDFYKTVLIPVTAALATYFGDVGRSYMALSAPILLLQLFGFYLLGRRLFGGNLMPALLALSSLLPFYIFSGELWGMLAAPLTRSAYAAIFPFLLLLAFAAAGRPLHVLALMVVCGAAVYVHPVSAPSVAFGLLAMSFFARPDGSSWARHAVAMTACGIVFLIIALPFLRAFADAFPSMSAATDAQFSRDILRENVGPQYYDASYALAELGRSFWLGLIGVAIASIVLMRQQQYRMLLAFAAGLLAASFGLSLIDQVIGEFRNTGPLQIDLIRNIRFIVPVALLAIFWMFSVLATRVWRFSRIVGPLAVGLTVAMWMALPNPIIQSARATFLQSEFVDRGSLEAASEMIAILGEQSPNTMVLPLPHRAGVEDIQLVGLAVRYGALQPVAYTFKDMNFLSYSSSAAIEEWLADTRRLDAASMDASLAPGALTEIVSERSIDLLLVNVDTPDGLTAAALSAGPVVARAGAWRIVAIRGER